MYKIPKMNYKIPKMNLYQIESDLQQLAELRDAAEAEGDSEALKVIDDQIAAYLTREPAKVDSYVGLIRKKMDYAAACELEADRLNQRAKALLMDVDRMKANALAVMQQFDVKAISSPTNTIRRQKNGGVQPLEVQPESVPDQYRLFRITFTYSMWISLLALIGDNLRDQMYEKVQSSPDTEAIRKALEQCVVCPECKGGGRAGGTLIEACPRCHGAGIIPATVPGARLLERGEHVRLA